MYDFTVNRYENALYDFVVHVEFNAAVFCEERKQIVDVVCEEPGRAGGKLTGDILDTFDNDVVFNVADTGSGDRAVAALVDGLRVSENNSPVSICR